MPSRALALSALATSVVALSSCATASSVGPLAPALAPADTPRWTVLRSPTSASLRGLSVVSERVVWASGANGVFLVTTDGGDTWSTGVVRGAESLDFRSVHAFDADHAVLLAAGAPARAFTTDDAGAHFRETYTRDEPGIFFDSLAFWDGRVGLALGDPLESADGLRFALLFTEDAGATWDAREGPLARVGEAAFAASNSVVALPAPGLALFATGGSVARVFRSTDGGRAWTSVELSASAPSASSGIFSLAFDTATHGYAAGGDYAAPTAPGTLARTLDGGLTWEALPPLRGFRSAVALARELVLVVGSSGSDLSRDGGATFTALDDEPLNAVAIAGSTAFGVGPSGRLARLELP